MLRQTNWFATDVPTPPLPTLPDCLPWQSSWQGGQAGLANTGKLMTQSLPVSPQLWLRLVSNWLPRVILMRMVHLGPTFDTYWVAMRVWRGRAWHQSPCCCCPSPTVVEYALVGSSYSWPTSPLSRHAVTTQTSCRAWHPASWHPLWSNFITKSEKVKNWKYFLWQKFSTIFVQLSCEIFLPQPEDA